MPKYDPAEDVPYGLAGVDLPVAFYDRPQLMFGNLLLGDVDGVTRAMLSPSTLSPHQMKTVRDVLLKGKKVNPVLKTIMDVATNPLVIIGLAVGLWKYPLGTTKSLLELRRGLIPKAATMNKMFSGLHDAAMNLRTIPNMFESLLGVTRETTKFIAKHGDDANQIFLKAGGLNKVEGAMVSARLDGLHKANHYMVKALRNEPEWLAFMGGQDVPIAANIQGKMNPRLLGLSDRLRGWFGRVRGEITKNPDVADRIQKAVEKKGLKFGGDVEDYFPHHGNYNRYYQQSLRGSTGVQYRKWLHKEVAEKVGKEEIARTGGMFANLAELKTLEETGAVKRGFSDMVQSILSRRTAGASSTIQGIWDDIGKLGFDEAGQRFEFVRRVREHYTRGPGKGLDFVRRLGSPKMADETLDAMAGAMQNARFKGADAVKTELLEIGRVLAEPAQYSLNPWESTGRYLNSVASSYAWHGTGLGNTIMGITKKPGIFREAPYLESYLMDDLIPHVQGLKSYQGMQRSLSFSVGKEKIYNWLKATPIVEATLGTKTKKWLVNYFEKPVIQNLTMDGLGAKISHMFYLSTLGVNVSPATKNLMQNFLTTMNVPGIGPQGIYRGLAGVAGQEGALVKMERYVKAIASGTKTKAAFNSAFPEYVKDMGEASQIVESLLAGDVAKEGFSKVIGAKGVLDKIRGGMMMPFSTSEGFNRIVGYYAGRNSHVFHNAKKLVGASAGARQALLDEAGQVGQSLTMVSHFTGGPLGVPKALINLWGPWRQFMHFPIRYASFLHGSLRMGMNPNKLDWGTIGRSLAGSSAAFIAARNVLGVNLESGLMTGALPVPTYEKAPFYPWPVTPPIVSTVGMGVKALMSGSIEDLGATAAMLVPGGVAARRVYRNLAPRFADYKNKTPDGRIPLYNDEKTLVGTVSPMQLTLRALGIQPTDVVAEQGAAKWLLSQRDRIRTYRRNYLQALSENDARKADGVNAEFQKAYPELGPIQVKKTDIRAMENRQQISRLHRIAKGIPSAYRPIFNQIINDASLGQMTQDLETSSLGMIPNYLQ